MSVIQKSRGKRITAFCMMLVCLFVASATQTVHAAWANNPVTFTVNQTFTKSDGSNPDDIFSYQLTAKGTGNPMPAGSTGDVYSFTMQGDESKWIGPISFPSAGTYTYELAQDVPAVKDGYGYDRQVYTIDVYVDLSLDVTTIVQNKAAAKVNDIQFNNTYKPLDSDPSLMVDPPVKKTVTGSPAKDGVFTFQLAAKVSTNPMPAGSKDGIKTLTIVGSGEEDFGTWSYEAPGTYYYTVSEVNTGEDGYTYDTAVYTITDVVTDENGQLVLARTVTDASDKEVSAYNFVNKYKAAKKAKEKKNKDKPTTGSKTVIRGTTVRTTAVVKTGDNTNIALYAVLAGVAAAGKRRIAGSSGILLVSSLAN